MHVHYAKACTESFDEATGSRNSKVSGNCDHASQCTRQYSNLARNRFIASESYSFAVCKVSIQRSVPYQREIAALPQEQSPRPGVVVSASITTYHLNDSYTRVFLYLRQKKRYLLLIKFWIKKYHLVFLDLDGNSIVIVKIMKLISIMIINLCFCRKMISSRPNNGPRHQGPLPTQAAPPSIGNSYTSVNQKLFPQTHIRKSSVSSDGGRSQSTASEV